MRERLGEPPQIEVFEWPGANNLWQRYEEANKLAASIEALRKKDPGRRQYVVGHSHGGNIAVLASRLTQIDGVATLATPFVHVALKPLAWRFRGTYQRAFAAVALTLSGMACLVFLPGWLVSGLIISAATAVAVCIPTALVYPNLDSKPYYWFRDEMTAALYWGTASEAFRVAGDEASLAWVSGKPLITFAERWSASRGGQSPWIGHSPC